MSSTTIGKAQIEVAVDASGVDVGVSSAKRSLAGLADAAAQAGARGKRGVTSIGEGGDDAARKVEQSTKSIISSIQIATAAMEAGSKSNASYFKSLASQQGVDANVFKPYLDQLDAAKAKQDAVIRSNALAENSFKSLSSAISGVSGSVDRINSSVDQMDTRSWSEKISGSISKGFSDGESRANSAIDSIASYAESKLVIAGVAIATGVSAVALSALYGAYKVVGEFASFASSMLTGEKYTNKTIDDVVALTKEVSSLQRSLVLSADGASALNEALTAAGIGNSAYVSTLEAATVAVRTNSEELDRLGVKYQSANGELLSQQEILSNVKAALDAYAEGYDRTAAAAAIGVGSYKAISDAISITTEKTDAARQKLMDYHLIVGDGTKEAAREYEKSMAVFNRESELMAQGLKKAIADGMMPVLTELAIYFKDGFPQVVTIFRQSIATVVSYMYGLKDTAADVAERVSASFSAMAGVVSRIGQAISKAAKTDMAGAWSDIAAIPEDVKNKWEQSNKAIADNAIKSAELWATSRKRAIALALGSDSFDVGDAPNAKSGWKKWTPEGGGGGSASGGTSQEVTEYNKLSEAIQKYVAQIEAELAGEQKLTEAQKLGVEVRRKLSEAHQSALSASLEKARDLEISLEMQRLMRQAEEEAAKALQARADKLRSGAEAIVADTLKIREHTAEIGLSASAIANLKSARDADTLATLQNELALLDATGQCTAYSEALRDNVAALRDRADALQSDSIIQASFDAAKEAEKTWKDTAKSIEQSITDALMRGFESGKDFASNLKDTLINMFKSLVLRPIIQATITGSVSGAAGAATIGTAGDPGSISIGGGGISSMLSTVKSAYDMITGGASNTYAALAKSTVGQSLGLSEAVSGGLGVPSVPGGVAGASSFSSVQITSLGESIGAGLATVGGGVIGSAIGTAIAGDKRVIDGVSSATVGAAIGSVFGPVGAFAGGVIGGIVDAAFGSGAKTVKASGISGTFSGAEFSGQSWDFWRKKGGWFGGGGKGTDYAPIDPEMEAALTSSFALLKLQVGKAAQDLGVDTQAIANYSKAIQVQLGDDAAANSQAIADMLDGISDDLAKLALAGSDFGRAGETAAQTLVRLSSSLVAVNDGLDLAHLKTMGVSLAAGAMASSLASAMGGIDGFRASISSYYDAYFSDAEKQQDLLSSLTKSFAAMGLALPDSKAAFRALVEGLDLTTAAGQATFAGMMSLSGAFAQMADTAQAAADATRAAVAEMADNLSEAFREAQARIKEESGAARKAEISARMEAEAEAREMASGFASSLVESFKALQSEQSQSMRGGSIGGLAYSAAEYEAVGSFAKFVSDANAALDEIAKSPLASTLADYTAEILALTKQIKDQAADKLFSSRMMDGDIDGAMAALLSKTELSFEKFMTDGKFNAGAFNADFEMKQLDAGRIIGEYMSANALKLQNAGGVGGFNPESVSQELRGALRREVAKELGVAGNENLTALLSGVIDSVVNSQLTDRYSPRGPGVASVAYAQANYESASETKYVNGRLVMGSRAIALAEGLEKLERAFSAGKITVLDYNQGLDVLHKTLGDTIPDINDSRLAAGAAAMQVAFAGMSSVSYYFGQIGEEVSRMAAAAKAAAEPVALVSGSIGRMNSAMSVFQQSASAWMGGALGMMGAAQAIISSDSATDNQIDAARELLGQGDAIRTEALKEGSQYRAAVLVSRAAGIASSVLTTQSAADAAKKIADKASFAGVGATKLRDVSLLLDGLTAFDSVALEGVFNKLANALSTKQISEAQFIDLFNLSISTFTDETKLLESEFGRLRDTVRSLADALLVGDLSTLNPGAKQAEAQRQYDETLAKARAGDEQALGELDTVTRNLLSIGRLSAASAVEYATLFGTVIAQLRSVESSSALTLASKAAPRLSLPAFASGGYYEGGLALVGEAGPELINFDRPGQVYNSAKTSKINAELVAEMQAMRAEIASLRQENNAGNAAVINATKRSAKALEKWDADGLPEPAV